MFLCLLVSFFQVLSPSNTINSGFREIWNSQFWQKGPFLKVRFWIKVKVGFWTNLGSKMRPAWSRTLKGNKTVPPCVWLKKQLKTKLVQNLTLKRKKLVQTLTGLTSQQACTHTLYIYTHACMRSRWSITHKIKMTIKTSASRNAMVCEECCLLSQALLPHVGTAGFTLMKINIKRQTWRSFQSQAEFRRRQQGCVGSESQAMAGPVFQGLLTPEFQAIPQNPDVPIVKCSWRISG